MDNDCLLIAVYAAVVYMETKASINTGTQQKAPKCKIFINLIIKIK